MALCGAVWQRRRTWLVAEIMLLLAVGRCSEKERCLSADIGIIYDCDLNRFAHLAMQVRLVPTTPSQDLRFANTACPRKVPSALVTDGFHIVKFAPCAWRAPIDAINNIRLALSLDTFGSRRGQFAQRCWRLQSDFETCRLSMRFRRFVFNF